MAVGRPGGGGGQRVLWAVVAGLLLLLASVIAAAVYAVSGQATMDEASLCESNGPTAVTTLLIDATDGIGRLQERAVWNRLQPLLKDLRRNERIELFAISPDKDLLEPIFSMCRPANGAETSAWTSNRNAADKRFAQIFEPKLEQALETLLKSPPAGASPIMEAVQASSVRSLHAPDLRSDEKGFRRRLILVSDLLQHSPALSQLRDVPEWEEFEGSAAMRSVSSDLAGTEVIILYLQRDESPVQGRPHVDFWDAWFAEQGATVENAIPVEG